MTLKYESELLFDLMKRDGDDAPSDVLPYESELKEKYLNQVVGAYPKLQDYRPEWLNYNLYHHLPSDFPVESVANVTSASFNNVVPYAYKSAILKGQTLVNLSNISSSDIISINNISFDISLRFKLKNLTTYTAIFNVVTLETPNDAWCGFMGNNGWGSATKSYKIGINKIAFTTYENSDCERLRLRGTNNAFKNLIILEGDYTNVDVPYFEGMQSVKMPVLTTSNEDGTKTNILTVNEPVELRGIGDVKDELNLITGELTQRVGEVVLDGSIDETWYSITNSGAPAAYVEGYVSAYIRLSNFQVGTSVKLINDKGLPRLPYTNTNSEGLFYLNNYIGDSALVLRIDKSKVANSIEEYLQANPITVQYQLATESIKTVDLSCINEQGESETFKPIEGTMHVSTSSQTLPPLLDMSVPVEATTQNLMSFANIVEEE